MATYLYGLVLARNAPRVPPGTPGVRAARVRLLPCGPLSALVSTLPQSPDSVSLDDVRAHDAVLQAAVDAGVTVAAVRFRQIFADDDDACRHIKERSDHVSRVLEENDGAVEMRLLLPASVNSVSSVASSPPENVGRGRAYLEALRRQPPPPLRRLIPQVRGEASSSLRNGIAIAHLVQRTDLEEYRARVATIPDLRDARIVGPLALYSFVEGEGVA